MTDFFNNITSISWWIGVVVVGILVNIAGMYLKSPIDRCLSSISTKYQTRSKAKKAERELKIRNLVGNKHEQILFASRINFTSLKGVACYLFAIFFTIMNTFLIVVAFLSITVTTVEKLWQLKAILLFGIMLGFLALFVGTSMFTEAIDDQKILKETKDRESKLSND